MPDDLSAFHRPVSQLFPSLENIDVQQFRLTDAQQKSYETDGFVEGIRVLNDSQIDALRGELQEFFSPNHAGCEYWYEYHSNESTSEDSILFHALGAWRVSAGFHDALWNPAFTIPASQLLKGPVRFWHDQLFCKPAKQGGVVAWHQDYSYWTRTTPMAHLTCWIGLDDSTATNGCLEYIPGSHQWDLLPITGLAGDMDAIKNVLTAEQWERLCDPVKIELQAGECAFHHPLMVHGSRENRTDRPRRAMVINVVRDGVLSDSDEEPLQGVPVIPKGQKLDGRFFPLLYADH